MVFKLIFLFTLLVSASVSGLNSNCITPNNELGTAKLFRECQELFKHRVNTTDAMRNLIQDSVLVKTKEKVTVCCPGRELPPAPEPSNECTSPDNVKGTCIRLDKCEKLNSIFKKRHRETPQNIEFLQRSQCGYKSLKVFVCCARESVDEQMTTSTMRTLQSSLLPTAPNCGTFTVDRIVGGKETKINEFLWTVLLEYKKPDNEKGFHCGGSLINQRYVLTAAHCLKKIPSSWSLKGVRIGDWNLETDVDCDPDDLTHCLPPPIDIVVTEQVVHPEYDVHGYNSFHDIALLRLARKINLSDLIMPICLPLAQHLREKNNTGTNFFVAGWGKTGNDTKSSIKYKVDLPFVSNEDCSEIYRRSEKRIIDSQMCAGGQEGKDSCGGDSGGPLMTKDTVHPLGYWYLSGLVSYGAVVCGTQGIPGVYTKVASYMEWIVDNIRK